MRVLKTDLKNAYGTVTRNAILRGLYKYAPLVHHLLRRSNHALPLSARLRGVGTNRGEAE